LLVASLLLLCSSRQNAVKALLATAIFMPLGQQFVFLGLHFYFSRVLIVVGVVRILARGEAQGFKLMTVDKLFLGWAAVMFLMGNLREGTFEAFISSSGAAYNGLGIYFIIRLLTRDADDLIAQLRFLALACAALAILILPELLTGRNVFSALGGVPLFSEMRE